MLFVSPERQPTPDQDPFGDLRLPAYFTLLVGSELIVDEEAFDRLVRSKGAHACKKLPDGAPARLAGACPRCRDVDNVRLMCGSGRRVRLVPALEDR